ncbi:hypothetical protein [Oceanobacillus alkalisoli]|uniref:hypothetical protein n=1 Tax=Oceanobacillus alkalisoli TaxID=2925113 RepID=UPI0034D96588
MPALDEEFVISYNNTEFKARKIGEIGLSLSKIKRGEVEPNFSSFFIINEGN